MGSFTVIDSEGCNRSLELELGNGRRFRIALEPKVGDKVAAAGKLDSMSASLHSTPLLEIEVVSVSVQLIFTPNSLFSP